MTIKELSKVVRDFATQVEKASGKKIDAVDVDIELDSWFTLRYENDDIEDVYKQEIYVDENDKPIPMYFKAV